MSAYIVSARKYRPRVFEEVVGQEHVTQTLYNEIRNDHLAQAFLFCGPRGVGKTTCARILAREINKESIQDENYDYSFNIFELDAASNNSVEDIRLLNEQVRIPPQLGRYKVYIIDEVHMLSSQAFNAFLKTLEEPPPYAVFILATTERHKILPTILSRCQIFNFSRIPVDRIVEHLQTIAQSEQVKVEEEALHVIAQKADGALRDALSIFDQMLSIGEVNSVLYREVLDHLNVLDYEIYFQITDACLKQDVVSVLLAFNEVLQKGFDPQVFINGLASHFRDVMVCRDPRSATLLEVTPAFRKKYTSTAGQMDLGYLVNAIHLLNEADLNFKSSRNQRLHVEITLIKLCYLTALLSGEEKKNDRPESGRLKPPPAPAQNQKAQSEKSSMPEIQPPLDKQEAMLDPLPVKESAGARHFTGFRPKETEVASISILHSILEEEEEEAEITPSMDSDKLVDREIGPEELALIYDSVREELSLKFEGSLSGVLKLIQAEFNVNKLTLKGSRSNILQVDLIKADFIQLLRRHTQSGSVELELLEVDVESGSSKPYTDREKFEAMALKNPLLRKLRDRLDLEFD